MNLDFSVVGSSLPYLWKGFQYTVQLTVTSALGGLFFGTLLALARLSSWKPLAMTANRVMAYVERRVAVPGYIGGGK